MGIQNFPTVLQPLIQQGFLSHALLRSLEATLAYRVIADKEPFPNTVGETVTKTRTGLRPVATTPLVPSAMSSNFDNGLTSSTPGVEQFVMSIAAYGDTQDLNLVTQKVGIANQFMINARQLAEQVGRTMDVLASQPLFKAYMGGNTRVRVTLGAPATTISVDDITGFQTVWNSNGVAVPVGTSGQNLAVTINGTAYTVSGATADGSNVSTAPFGVSGTLTTTTNVSTANGTIGNAVISGIAPAILRPNNRATTAALIAGDTLALVQNVLQAATNLKLNGVMPVPGTSLYHCYLDAQQLQGLFTDTNFLNAYRGAYGTREYHMGQIIDLMGVRFQPTTMAPQQTLGGLAIRRAIVVGEGALVEADFSLETPETDNPLAHIEDVNGVRFITRAPMDRLQQIIAQSWEWIGGFTVPTDITANPTVLPTASNAAYKRAVVIESL
jgi:hypothetical protein